MAAETPEPFLQIEWLTLLLRYWPVLCTAFIVAVVATPIARFVARNAGIVDRPDEARKLHKKPIAYLGGVVILVAVLAGIFVGDYTFLQVPDVFRHVPIAVLIGMFAIALTGLVDDIWGCDPWLKTSGQLVAAASLSLSEVGVNVAAGFFNGLFGQAQIEFYIPTPIGDISVDVTYWVGIAIIAVFVLGACNAANFIDGLDGLLSGVTGITAMGLIATSLIVAVMMTPEQLASIQANLPPDWLDMRGDGITLSGANIVLGLAVLGAVLGFLIFNFNPASIFLGDTGSLLLGYICIAMVLMLGEHGQTHIVVAGLIIFSLPILDALLAIVRRKIAGRPVTAPDSNHIHHIIKRKMIGVKRTVFVLYGISAIFCFLGVQLAWGHITGEIRAWVIYLVAGALFGGICIIGLREAKRYEQ